MLFCWHAMQCIEKFGTFRRKSFKADPNPKPSKHGPFCRKYQWCKSHPENDLCD